MKPFESFFARQLEEFITYRQSLGYDKRNIRTQLLLFDHYLTQQKNISAPLQPPFFLQLRADLQIQPSSVNKVLYATRCFFEYLVRKGDYPVNPLQDIPPLPQHAFIPFVFSPHQINQLLNVVCQKIRKTRNYFLKDFSVYIALMLLARCGMRISEPLRLKLKHYRPKEKTLYIEKTKFKKDRLIPVPTAVAKQIDNYLTARDALIKNDQNPYLLVGSKLKGLNDLRIRSAFHQTAEHIGLKRPREIIGNTIFGNPTPHSLRHSFAVHTLRSVLARGKSPRNALPVLATFMGHSEYRHTVKYLKVVDSHQREQLLNFAGSHREEL